MIEKIVSPYEEALENLPAQGSVIERMPYRELRLFAEALVLFVGVFVPTALFAALIASMAFNPARPDQAITLFLKPLCLWLVVVVGAQLATHFLRWSRWRLRKKANWIAAYLRHAGVVLLRWKLFLMTYRLDSEHKEVAAVIESDRRIKVPNTASVFLATVGLLGAFSYYAAFGHINGEIACHLLRISLLLLLTGLLTTPRVHWTSAVLAMATACLWISIGFQYVWPWYFYTLDVLAAALVLALLFYGYADWHYGKTSRFLYVANGELILVSPKLEFFEQMRVSCLHEEKVNLDEPLEWKEDFEGLVLKLPVETPSQTINTHFRLATKRELDFLEEQGIEIIDARDNVSPLVSLLKYEFRNCAVVSLSCLLGLVVLPVELQLYEVSVVGFELQFKKGQVGDMYSSLEKAVNLYPYSSILYAWKAIAAAEIGEFEVAFTSYDKAVDLSAKDGLAGELLQQLKDSNSLRFWKRATRLSDKPLEKVRAYLANYKELSPLYPRPETLLLHSIGVLKSSPEGRSQKLLIELCGYIKFRRYLAHSELFAVSAHKRLAETIKKANNITEQRTLARIYFNYERFKETTGVLNGSESPADRLLLASAGRYLGKPESDLLKLVEPLCDGKELGAEARQLKALILAQFGKVTESRKLLQGENCESARLLAVLVCNQQASRVLDKSLVDAHLNTMSTHYLKPHQLQIATLSDKDNVLAELCRFEWMSSVDLEHLVAIQKGGGFARLSKLDWYPYRTQASLMINRQVD